MKYSTLANREQIKQQISRQLDAFTTFVWNGQKSWEKYRVLIINDKNQRLKFYNGPSFTNEYIKTKFQNQSAFLSGINFDIQKIDFKVAIYGVTINEYEEILKWLSPYVINYLSFDYDPDYAYLVKLAAVSDSERVIIGQEDNEYLYYTELTLKWELQGPSYARAVSSINFTQDTEKSSDNTTYTFALRNAATSLPIPFVVNCPIAWNSKQDHYGLKISLIKKDSQQIETDNILLADITFNNIVFSTNPLDTTDYSTQEDPWVSYQAAQLDKKVMFLEYDSENGLITSVYGQTKQILSYLTENESGDYLVESLYSKKSLFTNDYQSYSLVISIEGGIFPTDSTDIEIPSYTPQLIMYPRKMIV